MSLLDDLMAYLQAEGVATEGTDLFAAALLDDQPDDVTVLFETSGAPDRDNFGGDGSPVIRRAGVQVRARSGPWDYVTAKARCEAARAALVRIANEDLSGTRYLRVQQVNGPLPLGRDESERWSVVANFDVEWQP